MIENYYITCVRYRKTNTTLNEYNRPIDSYSSTNINGYKGTMSNNLSYIAGKQSSEIEHNFYCDDFNLQYGDYILYEGLYYKVVTTPKDTTHQNHHIKCKIRHIVGLTSL